MNIDIERLRRDLIDYFYATYFYVSKSALIEINEVEDANEEELIQIAIDNNFKLEDYII
jgi:hypothetical protein